jgi:hypothetical protein
MLAKHNLTLLIEDDCSGSNLVTRPDDCRGDALHPGRQDAPDVEKKLFHNLSLQWTESGRSKYK